MASTLYHYVHCPFCVRVRMTFGLLNIPFNSKVLAYDDENTPVKLTGTKMLPIMETAKGAMNESLDIMAHLDEQNRLNIKATADTKEFKEFEAYVNFLSGYVHNLAMPYWIWTPEFNESSRAYFQNKKEVKRGPFKDLVKKSETFISALEQEWPRLEQELKPFYRSAELSLYDIILASHLWGLYVVPEFQFPPNIHSYLQRVKKECRFNYHEDFWR